MRLDDYLKGEAADIENCTVRRLCPFGAVCGVCGSADQPALFPTVLEVGKGELLWTDLRFEPRVFVIRQGAFTCFAHADQDKEVPIALYGAGIAVGMAELYVSQQGKDVPMSVQYFLRAMIDGRVCSLPASLVKGALECARPAYAQTVITCVLSNQFCSAYTMTKIVAHQSLYDRIVSLLLSFREIANRGSRKDIGSFCITHEEISQIIASDRVSTTRVLHKIRDDGLIELGYKSITLLDKIFDNTGLVEESLTEFYTIDEFI